MIIFRFTILSVVLLRRVSKPREATVTRKCHSIFGIQQLLQQEKPNYVVSRLPPELFDDAISMIKQHFFSQHVFCQSRKVDLINDRAVDEYLLGLLKQGNTLYAQANDGSIAGVCVNYASALVDPNNLRQYAFYRQDPNTKDFLYFNAKLQETPNLWNLFDQAKIFEIKMLTVDPAYRRRGIAILLTEKSRQQAQDQNFQIVRFDCINEFDFKIAERCMMYCLVKFPLHLLRGTNAPFIKKNSEFNRWIRVYIDAEIRPDIIEKICKIGVVTPNTMGELEIESLYE